MREVHSDKGKRKLRLLVWGFLNERLLAEVYCEQGRAGGGGRAFKQSKTTRTAFFIPPCGRRPSRSGCRGRRQCSLALRSTRTSRRTYSRGDNYFRLCKVSIKRQSFLAELRQSENDNGKSYQHVITQNASVLISEVWVQFRS